MVNLKATAQSEYHGERRAELVGDVGEEVLAKRTDPLQGEVVAVAQSVRVKSNNQHSCQHDQDNS